MSNKFFLEMLSEYLFLKLDFKKELLSIQKWEFSNATYFSVITHNKMNNKCMYNAKVI